MILCDVGVLLNAMVRHAEHHEPCRRELERLRLTPGELAVNDVILSAVVRIATNPKVFEPTPTANQVFEFITALAAPTEVRWISPGPRHWRLFEDLVISLDIQGPDVTDAYLAALAMESGCEWWTTDADFERFPGLRWRNLIA